MMTIDRHDLGAGAAFIAVGGLYGGIAWTSLPIGQTLSMGPGYFPLVLSIALAVIGCVLVGRSLLADAPPRPPETVAWRAAVAISGSIFLFGLCLRGAGMPLCVFVTAFLCAMAGRKTGWVRAICLAAVLAATSTGIFVYGLRLSLPVRGEWFGG